MIVCDILGVSAFDYGIVLFLIFVLSVTFLLSHIVFGLRSSRRVIYIEQNMFFAHYLL